MTQRQREYRIRRIQLASTMSAAYNAHKREFVSSGAPEDQDVTAAASKKCCLMNLCTMEPMTSLPEGDQFGRSREDNIVSHLQQIHFPERFIQRMIS